MVLVFVALLFIAFAGCSVSPPITTRLKAPWQHSDLVLESLEYVQEHHPRFYFKYLESFENVPVPRTAEEAYSISLERLYMLYTSDNVEQHQNRKAMDINITQSLFKLSLSLRVFSPRIQAFYSFYETNVVPEFSNSNNGFRKDCTVWADVNHTQVCDVEQLETVIQDIRLTKKKSYKNTYDTARVLSIDHVYPSKTSSGDQSLIILYADIYEKETFLFHKKLSELSEASQIRYILRYRPPSRGKDSDPVYLSGYGVILSIKKTDYIVIDDRKVTSAEATSEIFSEDSIDEENLIEKGVPVLKKFEKIDFELSSKSAELIMTSINPAKTLIYLSQNFPKLAHIVNERSAPSHEFSELCKKNFAAAQKLEDSRFWVNGIALEDSHVQPFLLLRLLQGEGKTLDALNRTGLNLNQARDFLISMTPEEESTKTVIDFRDDNVLVWINNLEKDTRYQSWPNSLQGLFRPLFPGQLYYISKNIFSILFVLDFSTAEGLSYFSELVNLVKNDIPFRFGFVPTVHLTSDQHEG